MQTEAPNRQVVHSEDFLKFSPSITYLPEDEPIDVFPMTTAAGDQPSAKWVRNHSHAGSLDSSKPATYASK